ncbi:MAG: META domain-containing protein [Methylococcaceae bacterium]
MKNWIILFGFAFALFVSCKNEQIVTDDNIYHTWEAKSFISVESVAYPKKEGVAILLTFKRDGTYYLKLDVNTCLGDFERGDNKSITIDYPPCTEKCCDSEFSNKLAAMLSKVTTYRITGDHLYLSVPEWGDIKLERRD